MLKNNFRGANSKTARTRKQIEATKTTSTTEVPNRKTEETKTPLKNPKIIERKVCCDMGFYSNQDFIIFSSSALENVFLNLAFLPLTLASHSFQVL